MGQLEQEDVWDENRPRDWYDVKKEATYGSLDVHLGHLFGIGMDKKVEVEAGCRIYPG